MNKFMLIFLYIIFIIFLIATQCIYSQTFTEIDVPFDDVSYSSVAWGDYDNDGDLDVLLTGFESNVRVSKIYRNNGGGSFTNVTASLTNVNASSVAWGDYDKDGDLDIFLTGYIGSGNSISKLYRNNGGGMFVDINAALPGVSSGSVAWGDYDNDGDLDILLTGTTGSIRIARIYRNDGGGNFVNINAGLYGVYNSSVAWGDYDNDGDLDILLTGYDGSDRISKIYRNNGGGNFVDINAALPGVSSGSVAWGDYDNDGDLDILLTGWVGSGGISRIYRNDGGGNFVNINAGLIGVYNSSVAWGDFDNDGDLDVLLTGAVGEVGRTSRIYRNDGGNVFALGPAFDGVHNGSVAVGDYDNDGDLDILLTGAKGPDYEYPTTLLYRNNIATANTPPNAPSGLSASPSGTSVTLSWNKSTDAQTPQNGLTYNIRVGKTPGGIQVCPPMANTTTGYRRIPQLGNTNHKNSWKIENLAEGVYSWSVQAIDNAFAGSAFAVQSTFTINLPPSPPQLTVASAGDKQVTLKWNTNPEYDILRYRIYYGTSPNPTTLKDSANYDQTTKIITGLTNGVQYYFRLKAVDNTMLVSDYSNQMSATPTLGAFSEFPTSLPAVRSGSVAWGDYDNDDDLDILLTGNDGVTYISKIFRNDGSGIFSDISASLIGLQNSSVDWGDYDGDGDLDILMCGIGELSGYSTFIYRNDSAGVFTLVSDLIVGTMYGSVNWGDYDNDGDLDFLLTGDAGWTLVSKIYRNDGGAMFTDISAPFIPVRYSSSAFGDYDNDGDLDVLILGNDGTNRITKVYKNVGNDNFVDISAGLVGVEKGSCAWGDYNLDGYLDIIITGFDGTNRITKIYKNVGGNSFVSISTTIPGVVDGTVSWGDYDNDGDLDVLLMGYDGTNSITIIYRNDQSDVFTDIGSAPPLTGVRWSSSTWGDYDNDGDLDIILCGQSATGRVTKIYKNNLTNFNTKPTTPTNLKIKKYSYPIILSWDKSNDNETAQSGLTYNIRVYSLTEGREIPALMANITNGWRKVPKYGNTMHNNNFIGYLPDGVYRWNVQAIDNCFAGSDLSPEQVFRICKAGKIISINDVPNDQGGKVRITWEKSSFDTLIADPQVTNYNIWRRIPEGFTKLYTFKKSNFVLNDSLGTLYDWVANVSALQSMQYNAVVPTLVDSSTSGINSFTFLITVHTTNPNVYFISELATGYSVDNIPPSAVKNLIAQIISPTLIKLKWSKNFVDKDFSHYVIYRSTIDGFPLHDSTRIALTKDTLWYDDNPPQSQDIYYRVTAVDINGNESQPSPQIRACSQVTQQMTMSAGWNMISLPLIVDDYRKSYLFPTAISNAFYYNYGYVKKDTLENRIGYWLKFSSPQSVQITGFAIDNDTFNLKSGWNMIGSISQEVLASNIISEPGGIVTSQFYTYNNGYVTSNVIIPGKAYWVKVNLDGKLILSSYTNKDESKRIKIVNISEMPPSPPDKLETLGTPREYCLEQNYPNPFNPTTVIRYNLPEESNVYISIFNLLGQEIVKLVDEKKEAGCYAIEFNAGEKFSTGIYYYRMSAKSVNSNRSYNDVRKMIILK